jgi:hypothetical protein
VENGEYDRCRVVGFGQHQERVDWWSGCRETVGHGTNSGLEGRDRILGVHPLAGPGDTDRFDVVSGRVDGGEYVASRYARDVVLG